MRLCSLLACVLALLPALAEADDVLLKSGGRISGQITSRTETAITVNVGAGIVTVPMSSVLSIEEAHSVLDEYDARVAKLRSEDATGWLQLAKWAAAEGLGTQARRAYERVAALDPQNVDANLALGRVLLDGRWVSEQESYRARGFVQFEGMWMTPVERDTIARERDAAWRTELARIDAERQARDAAVAFAQAEARARDAETAAAWSSVGIPLWWGAWSPILPGIHPPKGKGGRHRRDRNPYAPPPSWQQPQQMGTYPSPSMGTYPSQPIGGVWPSPSVTPPAEPPRRRPSADAPPPRVKGRSAGQPAAPAPERQPRQGGKR